MDRQGLAGAALLALAAWFLLQAVLRVLTATSLGLDEAELLVTTQSLELGYGPQPPLYVWLQFVVFRAFGTSIPSLALTKELILFGAFALFFAASRLVLGQPGRALVATLLLFSIPQIGWEAQRALSHSALVLLMSTASLYLFLRLLRDGRPLDYALFGLSVGLGLLSKYNFAIFALGLVLAALIDPGLRRRVLNWWFVLALLLGVVVSAPHFWWALNNPALMLASADKFALDQAAPLFERLRDALATCALAVVGFAILPVLLSVAVAVFPPLRRDAGAADAGWAAGRRFIVALTLVSLAIVIVITVGSSATSVRDRWLLPILFVVPLTLLVVFHRQLTIRRLRVLGALGLICAILSSAGLVVATVLPDMVGRAAHGTEPFAVFAATMKSRSPRPAFIISDSTHIAGNLKLGFPEATVASLDYPLWRAPAPTGQFSVLAAWEGDAVMPEVLQAWLQSLCGAVAEATPPPVHRREPFEHSTTAFYDLSFVVIPNCTVSAAGPSRG